MSVVTLVEIEYLDDQGELQVLRVSSLPYCTGRDDMPADMPYLPLLAAAPQISLSAFTDGRTGGAPKRQVGKISLTNADGRFDFLLTAPVDGRAVTIRIGLEDGAYPEDFAVWTKAIAEGVEAPTSGQLDVVIRDAMAIFDKPLANSTYAGDNALPNGVEGTADDIKGRSKPRVFGDCRNVTPICVNTSKLVFQLNDGPLTDIPAVYDRGVALARGADYIDLADMIATAPAVGEYRAWLAGGMVRIGSGVTRVTADALDGASAAARTLGQVLTRVAAAMGHAAVHAGDLTALDAAQPGVVGVYIDSDETALVIMDNLAAGLGCYVTMGDTGELRMGRLDAPAGAPVAELRDYMINDVRVLTSRDPGGGIPAHKVTLDYGRNWTPQADSDVAGSVLADRKAWLEQDYRAAVWESAPVLDAHPLAAQIDRACLLVDAAAADAEVVRLGALYGVRRMLLRVAASRPALVARWGTPRLGDLVRITYRRYGLTGGRLMCVIGVETRAAVDSVVLELWG